MPIEYPMFASYRINGSLISENKENEIKQTGQTMSSRSAVIVPLIRSIASRGTETVRT